MNATDFIPAHLISDTPPDGSPPPKKGHPAPLSFDAELLNELGIADAQTCGIIIGYGEAMKPTISGKCELLVDLSDNKLAEGNIYVLEIGSRVLIRRVKLLLRQIILTCDNPDYPDMVVEGEDLARLKVIGRVRYIGQRV